jgi:hypothetical protein
MNGGRNIQFEAEDMSDSKLLFIERKGFFT